MKSGKPLVLVVNRCGTVKRSSTDRQVRQPSHLRLVAAAGAPVARIAMGAEAAVAPAPAPRPPRALSRPLGQRVVQAANDVAVLAIAVLSGLYPRA